MPSFDSEIFCRDIISVLTGDGVPVTRYVSRKYKALKLSNKVNGYVRAGDASGEPLVVQGIDTVDVTNLDNVPMGQRRIAKSRHVLSEIYSIINEGVRAESRFSLRPVEYESGGKKEVYWIFEK